MFNTVDSSWATCAWNMYTRIMFIQGNSGLLGRGFNVEIDSYRISWGEFGNFNLDFCRAFSRDVKPTLLLKLYKHERLYHVQYGHCAALMSQPIHPSSNHKKICAQIHDICTSSKYLFCHDNTHTHTQVENSHTVLAFKGKKLLRRMKQTSLPSPSLEVSLVLAGSPNLMIPQNNQKNFSLESTGLI